MISRFFCIDKQSANFHNKVVLFSQGINIPGVAKKYISMSRTLKETVTKARVLDMGTASDQDRIISRHEIKQQVAQMMTAVLNAHKEGQFDEGETRELCTLLMQIDGIANEEIDMVLDPEKYNISEEAKVVANRTFRYKEKRAR
ncbi:hypothetical protein [Vibrio ulleungensis]|uniref:Co-chaperone DjlA N-terminal domain-containing protein n=1 Tax=Vibrio ulleungensis TaxID=2807619 RepID=A0ABS2HJH5_9VIBR|nr:hypothetical protein [Vibrio ulleungensis]MBM7037665.1 hypothetical protein [Vibrio ulleungensis]